MASVPDKSAPPIYASSKTFYAFLNTIRDSKHVPDRIDRTLMAKASGSVANEIMAALKYLGLTNDKAEPTALFEAFVMASDENRKAMLKEMLRRSYSFVFETPGFNLERATTQGLADLFRTKGVNGSTLVRAITFFLMAAKDAGVTVSPHVKAPQSPPRSSSPNPKKEKEAPAGLDVVKGDDKPKDDDKLPPGYQVFEIPIPTNRKVKITIPSDFEEADWVLLQTMFNAYVTRWKGYAATPAKEGK